MTSSAALEVAQVTAATRVAHRLLDELDRMLLGRADLHRMVLIGMLARGHILLEGLPGVGKTALVRALGEVMRLEFKRVQFTPDLMPADIVGNYILQGDGEGNRQMVYQPGPVFTNILLADEINRASPKTQSALLEAMGERSVSLMGVTRPLPDPFFVLASQNPVELEGTYPLPEAQLDRFVFKLHVEHVEPAVLEQIITTRRHGRMPEATWSMSGDELRSLFEVTQRILLPRAVARYISRLVAATHPAAAETTPEIGQYVSHGASPRAAIAIAETARAQALLAGRPTVGFEDVRHVAAAALGHRLILNYKARFDRIDGLSLVRTLLASLDESQLDLPADIQLTEASES